MVAGRAGCFVKQSDGGPVHRPRTPGFCAARIRSQRLQPFYGREAGARSGIQCGAAHREAGAITVLRMRVMRRLPDHRQIRVSSVSDRIDEPNPGHIDNPRPDPIDPPQPNHIDTPRPDRVQDPQPVEEPSREAAESN
jgi:hypothetical protein